MLNIVFMGTPDFAKESLKCLVEANHNILAVVTNPDKPQGRGMKMIGSPVKEYAMEKNLRIYQPIKVRNNEEFINQIKELKPDSLTVHTLAIKKASTLINDSQGALDKLRTYNIEDFMKISADAADYLGMKPYYLYRQKNMLSNLENIGYALEDKISLYNIAIMEEKQTIIAFGSGSVSKFTYPEENRIERVSNIKDVKLYIDNVEQVIAKKNKEVEKWI